MRTKENANIIGIQFSILSPDEIRKMSVAEITSRDTMNNKPVLMGSLIREWVWTVYLSYHGTTHEDPEELDVSLHTCFIFSTSKGGEVTAMLLLE